MREAGLTMDLTSAQRWLDAYVAAWLSYDRDDIAALFSEDVVYRFLPYDEPVTGRDAVVAAWLGEGPAEVASSRDAPGTYDATYSPVAVDGDVVVATGVSSYRDEPDGPVTQVFDNCFAMRFDADGRCRQFTEYYMRRPQ
jgi:ketosteroid isomerase-like protein